MLSSWEEIRNMERYQNSSLSPAERAEDLLAKLSPEEKLAQTQCVQVAENRINETGAFLQDAMSFPSGIARAASFDPETEQKIGSIVARQENAAGITHTLAPVLDISRDSRMGRQGETYGEDPALASAMGSAYTKGIQETAVVCGHGERHSEAVAKHFMGFHNALGGIHGGDSLTPPRLMEEIYGRPFQAAITEANLRGVMPCYCTFGGKPASASGHLLTEILRNRMKFDGLAVFDYCAVANVHQVQKVCESLTDAGEACMKAGMDVELPIVLAYNQELLDRFVSGEADMQILDTAVRRILEAKFRMGLFENPYALPDEQFDEVFFEKEDKKVTLKSAVESMVLLKNDGVLPVRNGVKKVALIL